MRVISTARNSSLQAVDNDLFAIFDDAEHDGSPFGVGEGADELRDGRGGRQYRLVFQQLGLGLTDAGERFLSDVHGV